MVVKYLHLSKGGAIRVNDGKDFAGMLAKNGLVLVQKQFPKKYVCEG